MKSHAIHPEGQIAPGVPFDNRIAAQECDVARGIASLDKVAVGEIHACRQQAFFQILQLSGFTDFHQPQQIGTNRPDHPHHGGPLGFGLSSVGSEFAVYAAGHRQVIFDIIAGDPDLTRRLPCKSTADKEKRGNASGEPKSSAREREHGNFLGLLLIVLALSSEDCRLGLRGRFGSGFY